MSDGDHWTVGPVDVSAAAEDRGRRHDGALLQVSTPIRALSSLGLSSDEENLLLRGAWDLLVDRLPAPIVGKRSSWRSFLFVLPGNRTVVEASVRSALDALTSHPELGRIAWHLSAADLEDDWQGVLRRVEDAANDAVDAGRASTVVWRSGDVDGSRSGAP